MSSLLVRDVFVPGRLPDYTYNPRTSVALESRLDDLIDEGGSIICVSGLTKMGKTVLVERLRPKSDNVRIDGSQFNNLDEFWEQVGDQLGIFPAITLTHSDGNTSTAALSGEVSVPLTAKFGSTGGYVATSSQQSTYAATRPTSSVTLEALIKSGKSLIIDDFHFIDRKLQRSVVRNLKDPVLRGLTIVFISTSHRTLDVILAEPNMDGRATPLQVALWSPEELSFIADKGFQVLNLTDTDREITQKLVENSFGSPHLMQKFCKRICALNGIRETCDRSTSISPPGDWDTFFKEQVEGVAERWFERLLRGPQERGTPRNKWERKSGGFADNYALIMEALARADTGFEVTKDKIKEIIDSITRGESPAVDKTTRALQRLSAIAARPLDGTVPLEDEMDEPHQGDIHSVLEFIDEGPNSKVHITDPFFAFYLKWGGVERIQRHVTEASTVH